METVNLYLYMSSKASRFRFGKKLFFFGIFLIVKSEVIISSLIYFSITSHLYKC